MAWYDDVLYYGTSGLFGNVVFKQDAQGNTVQRYDGGSIVDAVVPVSKTLDTITIVAIVGGIYLLSKK